MIKNENHKQCLKCFLEIISETFSDKKIKYSFSLSALLLIVAVSANISIPFLLKRIVESLSNSHIPFFILILLSYGFIWIVSQTSIHLRALLTYKIEQRITTTLGLKVLNHLYTLSQRYFLDQKSGAITNIIRKAQQSAPILITGVFFHILPTFLEFMCVICLVYSFYPFIYTFLFLLTLVFFIIHTFIGMRQTMNMRKKVNEIDKDVDGTVTDWLSNYEAIKIFGQQDLALHTCKVAIKEREHAEIAFMQKFCFVRLGQSLILGIGLTFITYFIGQDVLKGNLTTGDFVLFNGYMLQFILPMSILGLVSQEIRKALIDMKGIIDILLTKSDIKESANPYVLQGSRFHISFQEVYFKYDKKHVLENISFQIEPGETVLITGATGIGKSTIAKLLLRLYDPTEGEIFINNFNLKNIALQSLYHIISWVPQESYLLNDTIQNNILLADPSASLKQIEKALEQSHLLDFVKILPYGLNTLVGDRGLKLSGGEKQRLSLARIFLKKPKICIFDECTSSLDKETDLIIQRNIDKYLQKSTKIIITHRPFLTDKIHKVINMKEHSIQTI